MNWTDERVEQLKKLWTEGLSASQIAAQLGGVSRNAVIGKVHRLKLSGRGRATSAAPRQKKAQAAHGGAKSGGGARPTRTITATIGATALQALRRAAPAKGDHVLVQGAAGGVGTFAVQIAKALGARVTAVCSARNADQAGELGADRVVDYAITDVTAEGERYDVILGVNGYHPIRAYRRMLAPGGRYLMVGGGGRQMLEALALGRLLSLGGDRSLGFVTAKTGPEDLAELTRLIGEGSVRPVIDRTFPLAEAAEAMRHLGGGHARGKVVVAVE